MSTGHAVPFYCPYCGEEDIVPDVPEPDASGGPGPGSGPGPGPGSGGGHGHWSCRACLRAFRLSLTAIATVPRSSHAGYPGSPDSRTDSRTAVQS